jgi:hypothetical protein
MLIPWTIFWFWADNCSLSSSDTICRRPSFTAGTNAARWETIWISFDGLGGIAYIVNLKVSTFPDHIHIEERVEAAEPPNLSQVLRRIDGLLYPTGRQDSALNNKEYPETGR